MPKTITDIFDRTKAALAPLAGVTDSVYRRMCAEFGASPVMTEMISSDGYVRGRPGDKTHRLLRFKESERPLGIQFFGANADIMAEAARKVQDIKPDFIDINAGCPVKKVIAKCAGSALMKTPDILCQIVKKMAEASTAPVTVKIRSGWDFETINAVEVAQRCEDAGAQGIIVHPRTRSQGFGGESDWRIIAEVKKAVSVPVIGSGDIKSPEDAKRMLDETGANAVMVGRTALGNPWIFREIIAYLLNEPVPQPPGTEERLQFAVRQLETLAVEVSKRFAVLNMRKFFGWYSRGFRDGTHFRREIFLAETITEVKRIIREYLVKTQLYDIDENVDTHSVMVEK